jgi:hypothetical protein
VTERTRRWGAGDRRAGKAYAGQDVQSQEACQKQSSTRPGFVRLSETDPTTFNESQERS